MRVINNGENVKLHLKCRPHGDYEEMMELKDQVCSLDSAKRLKELGCVQESLFYWQWINDETTDGLENKWNIIINYEPCLDAERCISAYTTAYRQADAIIAAEADILESK